MSTSADVDEHTPCATCGTAKQMHYLVKPWVCGGFVSPPDQPEPHERVPALTITYWTCHECGYQHDVWGTGAIGTWMDCTVCGGSSFTDSTLGASVALGQEQWAPKPSEASGDRAPRPHPMILLHAPDGQAVSLASLVADYADGTVSADEVCERILLLLDEGD